MRLVLSCALGFFVATFVADATANLDLATLLWRYGWEKWPGWVMVWHRWSYAELHAFHLE